MEGEQFFKVFVLWKRGVPYEVRRFGVEKNKLPSFSFLVQRLQEIMPDLAKTKYSITWKDEEMDEVVISSDDELKIALAAMPNLVKLHIYCEEKDANDDTSNVIPKVVADAGASSSKLHIGVVCDNCDNGVFGFRYKCTACDDYDLCSQCEASGAHAEHCMVRIPMPNMPRTVIKAAVKHSRHFLKTVASKIEEDCKKRREPSSDKRRNEHGRTHGHGHGHGYRHRGHEHQRHQHSSWLETFASYMNEFANLAGDVNIEVDKSDTKKTMDQTKQPPKEESSSTTEQPQCAFTPENFDVINIQNLLQRYLGHSNTPQPKPPTSNNDVSKNASDAPEPQSHASANNDIEMGQGDRKSPEAEKESVISTISSENNSVKDDVPDEVDNWTVINAERDLMDDDKSNDPTPPIGFNLPEEFRDPAKSTGGLYPPLNSATAALNLQEPEKKENIVPTDKPQPSAPIDKPQPKPEPRKRHPVPHIDAAIDQMLAMGFTNEGGWLTQILENKNGNIVAVLDLLTPVNPKK